MLILFHTINFKESLTLDVNNLAQVVDYLKNNRIDLWNGIKESKLSYVLGSFTKESTPIPIYPTGPMIDFSSYDLLLVGDKVSLSTGIEEAAAVAASSAAFSAAGGVAGGAAAAAAATAASLVAYAATYIAISVAVSLAIGAIIQALSPTSTVSGDPSTSQSNKSFNGVPNIKEQGGSVPLVFGKCIFGGIVIAADMYSVSSGLHGISVAAGGVGEAPLVNVPGNSNWFRVG